MSLPSYEPSDSELPSLAAIEAELASRSLGLFTRLAWHVVEPAAQYVPGWHLDGINEHLEAVTRGEIRNLLINMPPRHMKSLAAAVFWPVWVWIRKPSYRWLFSSYAGSLSIRDSLKCRRLIESPWFQARWGSRFFLTGDQNAKMRFENDKTGYRIATSVGGAATGEGGDTVVVDDPHNVQERESDTIRDSTLIWWDETMSTRLNEPKTGSKVIVMQRVHEKDLSGHVLAQGGYEHLCLPAEYEPSRSCVTSLGWKDPRSVAGELLWPDRIGQKEIADFKLRLGPSGYAGQFQQTPTPAGGGRFKQAWFRYYTTDGEFYKLFKSDGSVKVVKIEDCDRFAMMDPAGTEKEQNNKPCYTVIGVWDITPEHDLLKVEHYRDMVEAPAAAEKGVELVRRYECPWIGVEKDGIGLGVVQTIKRRGVTVRPIKAKGSKEARSETAEIRMAAGMVYFPQGAPWLFEFEKELLNFPNSEYKDQVDEFSHAAMWVQRNCGAPTGEGDTSASPVAEEVAEREQKQQERQGHNALKEELEVLALMSDDL